VIINPYREGDDLTGRCLAYGGPLRSLERKPPTRGLEAVLAGITSEVKGRNTMETSREGRSMYVRMGMWLEKDGSIHLSAPGVPGFHVAINSDPRKPNGHPTLFKRLAKCLRDNGAPAPSDG
jgi:hypothetical protein